MSESRETFRMPTSGVGTSYIRETILQSERSKWGDNALLQKMEKFLSLLENLGVTLVDTDQDPMTFLSQLPIVGKEELSQVARDLWDLVKRFVATDRGVLTSGETQVRPDNWHGGGEKPVSKERLLEQENSKELREAILQHGSFLIHTAIGDGDAYQTVFDTRRLQYRKHDLGLMLDIDGVIGKKVTDKYKYHDYIHPYRMPLIRELVDKYPDGIREIVSIEPLQRWVTEATPQTKKAKKSKRLIEDKGQLHPVYHKEVVTSGNSEPSYKVRYYMHDAGVLSVRAGSGVFYLDMALPQSDTEQLVAALQKNPQIIRDLFTDLGRETEKGEIFADRDSKDIATKIVGVGNKSKGHMLILDGGHRIDVTKYQTLLYKAGDMVSPQHAFGDYNFKYYRDNGRAFKDNPELRKDFIKLIADHTVSYKSKNK